MRHHVFNQDAGRTRRHAQDGGGNNAPSVPRVSQTCLLNQGLLSSCLPGQNLLTSGLPSQGLLASCRPRLSPRPRWPPHLRMRLFGQDWLLVCWTHHWCRCEQLASPGLRPRSSQSPLRPRSSQSPPQRPLRPRSSQSPLRPRSSQSPLQRPLRPRSSQRPLRSRSGLCELPTTPIIHCTYDTHIPIHHCTNHTAVTNHSLALIVSPHLHLIHTHTYKQHTSMHSPQSLV